MRRYWLAAALSTLASPLFSQNEAAFINALRNGQEALQLKAFSRQLEDRRIAERLSAYLDWYDLMERQPGMDVGAVSQAVTSGLRSGAYTGLIMGESHGVDAEDKAGRKLVADVLDAGLPVGAFLREENLFPHTEPLDQRRIPILTYRNQFKPEDDVKAGLKSAGKKLLVSYSGCAHTAVRIKDFFLYTLEDGKTWHYEKGKRDMPTIEESYLHHGKRPLIVAMSAEDTILGKIQWLFLRALAGGGTDLERLRGDIDALLAAWTRQMAAYPVRSGPISFVRSPEQPNLYAGLTPTERRAFEIEAVRKVLALPEVAAWLAGGRIKSVESLRGGSFTPPDHHEWHYEVVVHALAGGEFRRVVDETELRP